MFLVVVVLARCLLKIVFSTLNRYFEEKKFHLLLDRNAQAMQSLALFTAVGC